MDACDRSKMGGGNGLGSLIDISATRLVVIHDEWVGYNPHSPIAALYELRRGPRGGLFGEGRLSSRLAGERVVDVTITAGAAKKFLDVISGAKLVEEPYQPLREWTDDYPHVEIALHVGVGGIGRRGGIALLFTESQGEFHAPWGAFVDGRSWTVPGDEIGRALAALKAPLKRATLDGMMRDFERQATRR